MKITLVGLLFAFICLLQQIETEGGSSCIAGTEWFSECSHCHCPASGQDPICENVGCPVCKLGHRWNANCGSCFCLRGGHAVCKKTSQQNCLEQHSEDKGCRKGAEWHEGCNKCFCTENGYTACTKRECKVRYNSNKECEPGKIWLEECKKCLCTDEGLIACESRSCNGPVKPPSKNNLPTSPAPTKEASKCKPRTVWKVDCNRCMCTDYGRVICTKRDCDAPVTQVMPDEATTATAAPEPPTLPTVSNVKPTIRHACRPRDRWEEGCAQCHCSEEGVPICIGVMCRPGGDLMGGGEMESGEVVGDEEEGVVAGSGWHPELGPVAKDKTDGVNFESGAIRKRMYRPKKRDEEEKRVKNEEERKEEDERRQMLVRPKMYRPRRKETEEKEVEEEKVEEEKRQIWVRPKMYRPRRRELEESERDSDIVERKVEETKKGEMKERVEIGELENDHKAMYRPRKREEKRTSERENEDEEKEVVRRHGRYRHRPLKRQEELKEEPEEPQAETRVQKSEGKYRHHQLKRMEEEVEKPERRQMKGRYRHRRLKRQTSGIPCDAGAEWTSDCNVCICRPDGVSLCTKMNCAGGRRRQRRPWSWRDAVAATQRHCRPFEVNISDDGCNACVCNENGVPVCTQMDCGRSSELKEASSSGTEEDVPPPPTPLPSASSSGPEDVCRPGNRWVIDCVECKCDENKREICQRSEQCDTSRRKEELEGEPEKQKIDRGEYERQRLPEAQNRDKSSSIALSASSSVSFSSTSSPSCQSGSVWKSESSKRGCRNICKCLESGVAECREKCRRADAEDRLEEEGEEEEGRGGRRCRPNSEWMEKCNRCRCSSTGKRVCTEMNCETNNGP